MSSTSSRLGNAVPARIALLALAAALSLVLPTAASANTRQGDFQCRGTALRVGNTEVGVSNRPGIPCRTNVARPVDQDLTVGSARLVVWGPSSSTRSFPPEYRQAAPRAGDGASAQAGASGITLVLGKNVIQVGAVRALDAAICLNRTDPPILTGLHDEPQVAGLTINGKSTLVNKPTTIPLGILTLKLAQQTRTGNTLTQRAFEVTSPVLPTIVIGEAVVGYTGNPCAPAG
jgi:hypothetical protein